MQIGAIAGRRSSWSRTRPMTNSLVVDGLGPKLLKPDARECEFRSATRIAVVGWTRMVSLITKGERRAGIELAIALFVFPDYLLMRDARPDSSTSSSSNVLWLCRLGLRRQDARLIGPLLDSSSNHQSSACFSSSVAVHARWGLDVDNNSTSPSPSPIALRTATQRPSSPTTPATASPDSRLCIANNHHNLFDSLRQAPASAIIA